MKIGFTGTRSGMTSQQMEACAGFLLRFSPEELHHGDAIGSDAAAHDLAINQSIRVVVHPPSNPSHRAFSEGAEVREELPYLVRNRAIVDATDLLLATPTGPEVSAPRSGTWRTVRYARQAGRRVIVIYPDGEVSEQN